MELRQLRYFAAVANELHFSRAAQQLSVAQPALSHQIRQLERELDVELFTRTTRAVDLTPAGEALADEAEAILRCVERVAAASRAKTDVRHGTLRIAATPSALTTVLPALLRAFHERAPHIDIELREAGNQSQLEALRAGDLDAGIVHAPLGADDMASQPLVEEKLMAVIPADHPLAESSEIPLAALADESFVLFPRTRSTGLHEELIAHCRHRGFTPRIEYEVVAMSVALAIVRAGLGVTLLPASLGQGPQLGAVFVPVTSPTPTIIQLLIWRRGASPPALPLLRRAASAYAAHRNT